MNILLLGKGKTGSLVAEIAIERQHKVSVVGREQNADGQALVTDNLRDVDVVVDFTTPDAVLPNIEACARQAAVHDPEFRSLPRPTGAATSTPASQVRPWSDCSATASPRATS